MIVRKLKIAKCIRTKMLLFSLAAWVFTTLILIIENGEMGELIFIPIGAIILTLVYFKMDAFIKKLERMPDVNRRELYFRMRNRGSSVFNLIKWEKSNQ